MALVAQEIPKIGLVMENTRLVRWLKNVGDTITQGEALLELETEKSVVEIEAAVSGRLVEKLIGVDQEVRVGDRVAWVESDTAQSSGHAAVPAAAGTPVEPEQAAPQRGAQANGTVSATTQPRPNARIKSSPVARRIAAQAGIDLATVPGTGPRGRVQLKDIQRAVEACSAERRGAAVPGAAQQLSGMRRALARTMALSNATVPQFIVARAVDWTSLHCVRSGLNASLPAGAPKPSVNDFLLQAVARALLTFPALNATFSGDPDSTDARIVPANGAHIGLVVAVESGILVPVIHDADQLGLAELARRRRTCVDRALKGRLKGEELEGATFSLSNLGARGPDRFTALINPPQSAILAVGRQRDCVVARDGGIHVRPMSDLSLTVDHRVADGRLASDFLAYVVEILEGLEWRT